MFTLISGLTLVLFFRVWIAGTQLIVGAALLGRFLYVPADYVSVKIASFCTDMFAWCTLCCCYNPMIYMYFIFFIARKGR